MARIKIEMPSTFIFTTEIPVRIGDVNYGGHVGNDAILSIMHEARLLFFNHFGYSELDLGGVSTIMADCAIVYKGESFHGDTLRIGVTAAEPTKYGFDLYYDIRKNAENLAVAEGKTGIVCFDYSVRKVASLPEEVKVKFGL